MIQIIIKKSQYKLAPQNTKKLVKKKDAAKTQKKV
jgi:hypothetical protein